MDRWNILQLAASHTLEMKPSISMSSQVVQKMVADAQKPLTNVRICWISPTEEKDQIIEKFTALIRYNAYIQYSKLNVYMIQM